MSVCIPTLKLSFYQYNSIHLFAFLSYFFEEMHHEDDDDDDDDDDLSFLRESSGSLASTAKSESNLSATSSTVPVTPFRNVVAHNNKGESDEDLQNYMRSISIEPRRTPLDDLQARPHIHGCSVFS